MMPVRAWIGLGSNLGDAADCVRTAIQELGKLPGTTLGPVSGLYRTAPVGVIDQPDFCNAVAAVDTTLSPLELLSHLQTMEQDYGRVRTRRWGPRTLDLDVLTYGEQRINQPELTVPHPRLHERGFVLVPLAAVAPAMMVPGVGRVDELVAAVEAQDVIPWEAA